MAGCEQINAFTWSVDGVTEIEKKNDLYMQNAWWTVFMTSSTVGYGDLVPIPNPDLMALWRAALEIPVFAPSSPSSPSAPSVLCNSLTLCAFAVPTHASGTHRGCWISIGWNSIDLCEFSINHPSSTWPETTFWRDV